MKKQFSNQTTTNVPFGELKGLVLRGSKGLFLLIAVMAIVFTGCKKDEPEPTPEPALSVTPATLSATDAGGSPTIAVTSNVTWTATKDANATWLSLSPASATGNGTVTVNIPANPSVEARSATITIAAGTLSRTVTVTQAAAAPVLDVDETPIDAAYTAGSYTIAVTSNLSWTAAKDAAATWLSLSPASATGNRTVTVNVAENPATVIRSATITVAAGTLSHTVDITQQASPPPSSNTPPHAASTQTWTFGGQTWSDVIHIPECNGATLAFSNTEPYCGSAILGQDTRYYYNWPYAKINEQALCPSPWRLPTLDDAMDIVMFTDYDELIAEWGLGGTMQYGNVGNPDAEAAYWTSSPYYDEDLDWQSDVQSWHLYYTSGVRIGVITLPPAMAVTLAGNNTGMQVRCVKDN